MKYLLILIIVGAFLIRVVNLNYNSPFLDEATYILQGQLILGGSIQQVINNISWIGGFPFFYPLLSYIFYLVGGIVGSRFLNVLLGTTAVFLIYHFTYALSFFDEDRQNRASALASAVLMAFLPIPIALSRIATYDMLSYTLLLAAVTLFTIGLKSKSQKLVILASASIFLGILAKYISSIALIPLALLTIYFLIRKKYREEGELLLQDFWGPIFILSFFYAVTIFSLLWEYIVEHGQSEMASYLDVIKIYVQYIWIPILLGASYIFIKSMRNIRNLFFLICSFIPLFLHLVTRNTTSAAQHSFLSLFTLLPLCGAVGVNLLKKTGLQQLPKIALITFIIIFYWTTLRYDLEHFWPNISSALNYLSQNVSSNDKVLAETDDVVAITLAPAIPLSNIHGPFAFEYKELEGNQAYIKAIQDGYFQYIETDGSHFSNDLLQAIEEETSASYNKVFDDGIARIYRLNI